MGLVLSRKSLAELYQLRASWNIFEDQSSWAKQRLWRWAGWLPAVVLQTLDWQICTNWTTWIVKLAKFGQLGLAILHNLENLDWQICTIWTTWIGRLAAGSSGAWIGRAVSTLSQFP